MSTNFNYWSKNIFLENIFYFCRNFSKFAKLYVSTWIFIKKYKIFWFSSIKTSVFCVFCCFRGFFSKNFLSEFNILVQKSCSFSNYCPISIKIIFSRAKALSWPSLKSLTSRERELLLEHDLNFNPVFFQTFKGFFTSKKGEMDIAFWWISKKCYKRSKLLVKRREFLLSLSHGVLF